MAHSGQDSSPYHNWASFAQPALDLQLEREHDFLQQASGFGPMPASASQAGYHQYYPSQPYHQQQQHISDPYSIASGPARMTEFRHPMSSNGGGTTGSVHAATSAGSHAILPQQQHTQSSYPHTATGITNGALNLNTSPHGDNPFAAPGTVRTSPMSHLYSQIPASTNSDLQRSTERMTALEEASAGFNNNRQMFTAQTGGHQRTASSTSPVTSPTKPQFNKNNNNNNNNNRVFAAVPSRSAFSLAKPGSSDQQMPLGAGAGPREIQLSTQQQQQLQRHVSLERKAKRPREEGDDNEEEGAQKEGEKSENKTRACQRCKDLKVKCEDRTDEDPCKRCLNAGSPCFIPGARPRKVPPKREVLQRTIDKQSAHIQELEAKLKALEISSSTSPAVRNGPTRSGPVGTAAIPDLVSPVLDHISPPVEGELSSEAPDVFKWVKPEDTSLSTFDGLVNSGVGLTREMLVERDHEDSDSDDTDGYETVGSGLSGEGGEGDHGVDANHRIDRGAAVGGEGVYERQGGMLSGEEIPHAIIASSGDTFVGGGMHEYSSLSPAASSAVVSPVQAYRVFSSMSPGGASAGGHSSIGGVSSSSNNGGPGGSADNKLSTIPTGASAFGLMAELVLKKQQKQQQRSNTTEGEGVEVGPGSKGFFKPSPGPDPNRLYEPRLPYLLTRRIISTDQAEKYFDIYHKYMNPSVSLLDPVLYTARRTAFRSSFLFTVICAIASRFDTENPGLYSQLMYYAQLAAGTALISGAKNVESCHAYILLALYPVPVRRWEEDRSWTYLGLAIRIATDLNLHHPTTAKPINEHHAREMLNRHRVWLNCYNLDRSMGSQYGKSPIIKTNDFLVSHSQDWWCSSPYNVPNFDIHICVYNADARVISEFMGKIYNDPNHPTGLNKDADFEGLASEADDELQRVRDHWFDRLEKMDQSHPQMRFRTSLLALAFNYARLTVLSFGFQHAFGRNENEESENSYLNRCLIAAKDVVHQFVHDVGRPEQRTYLRHGVTAQSVFVTFAASFLVKLMQPRYARFISRDERIEIRRHVQEVIELLSGPDVAIDDKHGPMLYSMFLKDLLRSPTAQVDLPTSAVPPRRKHRKNKARNEHINGASMDSSYFNHPSPFSESSRSGASMSPPATSPAQELPTLMFEEATPSANAAMNTSQQMSYSGQYGAPAPHAGVSPASEMMQQQQQPQQYWTTPELVSAPFPFDTEMLQSMDPSFSDITLPGFGWMSHMQNQVPDTDMFNLTEGDLFGIGSSAETQYVS